MGTFLEFGIPFPLYEAQVSVSDETEYVGPGRCCTCGITAEHTFLLGIGDYLINRCPNCNAENGLDVDAKASVECCDCNTQIPFPLTYAETHEPNVCYSCLRSGKATLTKDTEFGLVSWEQAFRGVTHGLPALETDQFETVPTSDDGEWFGAKVPSEMLWELLRTPTYGTWQGEHWLFCCNAPMTFEGEWTQQDFSRHDENGNGKALCLDVVPDLPEDAWDSVGGHACVYVFQCKQCKEYRGHWDCD